MTPTSISSSASTRRHLLIRERPDGTREVLASHFEGKELNSPNDVCVRSDGSIYFTDPYYGRVPVFGVERPRELGFQAVYRLAPDGGGLQSRGRSRSVRAAERPLPFAGREAALRQRQREKADPRVQRRARRLVVGRASVRKRDPVVVAERRARRDEMRRARECLGHRPGRRLGLRTVRRADRESCTSRRSWPISPGAATSCAPYS